MNTALPLPAIAWPRPAALPRPLRLAIGLSIGIHALALLVQGKGLTPPPAPPPTLEIVLRAPLPLPQPVQLAPVSQPSVERQPPAQLPPRIETRARAPQAAPHPAPTLPRPLAQPSSTAPALRSDPSPTTSALAAPVIENPAPPAVSIAAPRPVHAEPAVVAAPTADEPLDPALLERYGRSLSSLFARQQNYPRLAAMRGWEGEVQVRITIARKGNIVAAQVVRSSGFEVLDQSAIQLVSGAGQLPRPPEALQNRELQIVVPVLFKLEKPA